MLELFLTIGIAQIVFPVFIIAWQFFDSSKSRVYWILKTTLSLCYLIAIAIAGLWTYLPFYVPYLFLGLSLILAIFSFKRFKELDWWKAETVWSKICFGVLALFTSLIIGVAVYAISGWFMPSGDVANLSFPLANGTYSIANGGSNSLLNPHFMTLEGEKFRAYRGQSYAVDIIKLNSWGNRAEGILPNDPARYEIFGDPVYSLCDGTVLETENGREDMSPPQVDRELITGNHALLECGDLMIFLGHFKKGSVLVLPKQKVKVGQELGKVGNSGNTGEPHLHIHAQKRGTTNTALDGDPVWMLLDGKFLVRNQIISKVQK